MRIGFDVSQTGANKAGCGYFAYSLIEQLLQLDRDNQYILYSNFGPDFWDPDHARDTFQSKLPNVSRRFAHFTHGEAQRFWHNPGPDVAKHLGQPDVVHANNFYCPAGLGRARLVYTLYDLAVVAHPEYSTEANRLVCFNGLFEASLYADMFVSISHFSKQHFLEVFPHYPADRIKVCHPASRFTLTDNLPQGGNLAQRLPLDAYWLSVGTLEPRKNIRRLLETYARLRHEKLTEMPLVMAGGKGWLEDDLAQFIDDLGIGDTVELLGYVSDDQLEWLYRHCFAFVYPSLFEGFGLPVLEAMSLGAAVITANVTSLPEIAGDAALLVDPLDTTILAEAMVRLQNDSRLRCNLQKQALARSELFSWEKTAEAVLNIYRSLS